MMDWNNDYEEVAKLMSLLDTHSTRIMQMHQVIISIRYLPDSSKGPVQSDYPQGEYPI